MSLPADGFIFVSYVNTKLRDGYSSLEELCLAENEDLNDVLLRIAAEGYFYDAANNALKQK